MTVTVVEDQHLIPATKSMEAEASSAHARINVPLNLDNWRNRTPEEQDSLLWFHQHLLDSNLPWADACAALGYDRSTIFRVLKGTYTGNWENITKAINSYRKLSEDRSTIQKQQFTETSVSRLVFAGLDYALANNSITTITGESRSGKSISTLEWCRLNNHGRSVYVVAPPIGGSKALLRAIASRIGVNKSQPMPSLVEAIHRAFNKNRILIVDEAHRLMPADYRTLNPANLELLRDIHDQTDCGLALIATMRFTERLKTGAYQFEQLVGRIGMPIRLPKTIQKRDVLTIVRQFVDKPSEAVIDQLHDMSNRPGRLGIVCETLRVASRMAAKKKQPLSEEYIERAATLRHQMSGGWE